MPDRFDYSERDPKGRVRAVEEALKGPAPSRAQLSAMADYLLFVSDSGSTMGERRREYPILTRNRSATIAKREVSAESMRVDGMPVEDTLSSLASDAPPESLGPRRQVPVGECGPDWRVEENGRTVESLKGQADRADGRRRFELKRQVISTYRERAAIRESAFPTIPVVSRSACPPDAPSALSDDVVLDPQTLVPRGRRGLTMCDEPCVRALLSDYRALSALSAGDGRSDVAAMLVDLDDALDAIYGNDAVMRLLIDLKKDRCSDADVAEEMARRLGVHRTEKYWSQQWRLYVPRAVCDRARRLWLLRHWGKWKICRGCGRALPAHPMWFTRNTSRDGYYSRCKDCRRSGGNAD